MFIAASVLPLHHPHLYRPYITLIEKVPPEKKPMDLAFSYRMPKKRMPQIGIGNKLFAIHSEQPALLGIPQIVLNDIEHGRADAPVCGKRRDRRRAQLLGDEATLEDACE
jgi:hypothetical protein